MNDGVWILVLAAFTAVIVDYGCGSDDGGDDAAAAAGMGGSVFVGASGGAGGQGGSLTNGISGAGTSAAAGSGAPSRDTCARAMAMQSDITALGALGMCVPPGIALACRTDSPEYTCSETPSADTTSLNKCRDTSDCAVLAAANMRAKAMMGQTVSNLVRGCGLPYLSQTDCGAVEVGTTECVTTETQKILAPGLSADCSSCFTQTLLCNLKCLMHCSVDAESAACVACMHVQGCRGLFYQCSGLEPVD